MRTHKTVTARAFAGLLAFALGAAACTGSETADPNTSDQVTDIDGDDLLNPSDRDIDGDDRVNRLDRDMDGDGVRNSSDDMPRGSK